MTNGNYQYSLVEKLSFTRYGGTEAELKAAEILKKEAESFGGEAQLMNFTIPAFEYSACSLRVTAPYEKEYDCAPCGMVGCINKELKLIYVEQGTDFDLRKYDDLSEYAVIINELSKDTYKRLALKKAGAFIAFKGKWYSRSEDVDIIPRPIRPGMLKNGKVPGFIMRAADITEIVRLHGEKVQLHLEEREYETTSRNVVATIPGTEDNGEAVVVTAHYDSIPVGTGSWDNATGSATIMWLYRHFLANRPRRTMHFIWCGSEEQGLLGSRAWIEQHEEEVKKIKMCFNFDMCGTVLGPNRLTITGKEPLERYVESYCKEVGFSADSTCTLHSSDSAPFADRGIPAVGISRGSKSAEIHTHNDVITPLSAEAMAITTDFAIPFMERLINSDVFPIEPGMPQHILELLDKRFRDL